MPYADQLPHVVKRPCDSMCEWCTCEPAFRYVRIVPGSVRHSEDYIDLCDDCARDFRLAVIETPVSPVLEDAKEFRQRIATMCGDAALDFADKIIPPEAAMCVVVIVQDDDGSSIRASSNVGNPMGVLERTLSGRKTLHEIKPRKPKR